MVKELYELRPAIYGRYDELEMLPVMRDDGTKCIVYGAGKGGRFVVSWLKRIYKIVPEFIVDRLPIADSIDGVPVIPCEEFEKAGVNGKFLVIIAIAAYREDKGTRTEIDKAVKKAGRNAEYITYDAYDLLAPYDLGWYDYIKENAELFERTYGWLTDDMSRETMVYYLRTIILGEKYSGVTFAEQYKYWGIDNEEETLFKLSDDEVLLNVGGARGDTVFQFLKCRKQYKKIITVEAAKPEFEKLKKNLGFLGYDILQKIQVDNHFLGAEGKTIDTLYADEDISLINMDIEGAELSVLKTAVDTIRKNRPVLSICAYHKEKDLVEIPAWIRQNVDNYIFALRKYPSTWRVDRVQMLDIPELVLYAIPRERYAE